jgi:hypothetical protein
MSTSNNEQYEKRAKDPFDILIHEKGLRISNMLLDKKLDLIVIILNNGKVLQSHISYYQRLKEATQEQLNQWRLISGGVGVCWENLNEDLSVKGFIRTAVLNSALLDLQDNKPLSNNIVA